MGSAPQRQALALTHGPGIGEWREGRTHPRKAGARARCVYFKGDVREEQFSSVPPMTEDDKETLGVLPPFPHFLCNPPGNTPCILSSHLPTGVMLTWSLCKGLAAEPDPLSILGSLEVRSSDKLFCS